jgi:hypothetical protein
LTLCVAWLTACLTPGEIAYASSVAAIPTVAMTSASRGLPWPILEGPPGGGAGRALNGDIDMPWDGN